MKRIKVLTMIGIVVVVLTIVFNTLQISSLSNKLGDLKLTIAGVQNLLFIEAGDLSRDLLQTAEVLEEVIAVQVLMSTTQQLLAQQIKYLLHNVDPKPNLLKLRLATVEIKVGRAGGAGTIIAQDEEYLYILTAKHILNRYKTGKIEVQVTNSERELIRIKDIPRENAKVDDRVDIGLLKINKPEGVFENLALCQENPRIGTKIYTIGHPVKFHYTVTGGIVSNYIQRKVGQKEEEYMLLSAPSFSGNSGGAAINCYNELVGVVVGIMYVGNPRKPTFLYHLTIATNLDHIYRFLDELQDKKNSENIVD